MIRLIDQPDLAKVAKKHNKTVVQMALAWATSQGRVVIPKSVIKWQIKENLGAQFDLDEEDLEVIRYYGQEGAL
jgi:alcohol dehydrogenase (NADP+)